MSKLHSVQLSATKRDQIAAICSIELNKSLWLWSEMEKADRVSE